MQINYWKVATVSLVCFLLIGLGYELNSWLKPTNVKAQEAVPTETPGRFQLVSSIKENGVGNDRWLLDTATGRVFWVGGVKEYGYATIQEEIPIKSCADAECATRKGTKDAQ
jgi:hypothetical protein